VNNTEKLDEIRRRLAVMEVRQMVILRACSTLYERVIGGELASEGEYAILHAEPVPRAWQRARQSTRGRAVRDEQLRG
jgi:hypothetical protein